MKGPNGEKRPADVVGSAVHVAKIATGEISETTYKQPAKAKSGKMGGKARAKSLTPQRRAEIAKAAADSRWR